MNGSAPPTTSAQATESGARDASGTAVPRGSALAEPPSYPYPDLPLEKTKRQIRLLHLAPGRHNSPLRGRLTVVDLDSQPVYEALSYTWGRTTLDKQIAIDGSFDIPITDNLYAGLRRLRYHFRTRVFWIDAICINQCSIEERGHQVSFMGDIYATARRVCVWLGDIDNTGRTIELMSRLYEPPEHASRYGDGWKSAHAGRVKMWQNELIKTLESVLTVNQPAWHTRSWVYQEVLHAREIIWCFHVFAVKDGPYAFSCYDRTSTRYPNTGTFVSTHLFVFSIAPDMRLGKLLQDGTSLFSLDIYRHAMRTQTLQSQDPRDRVYSLLSVIPPAEAQLIQPDYSKSCSQVYAEGTYAALVGTGNLQILLEELYENQWGGIKLSATKVESLPSWAINFGWGTRSMTRPLETQIWPDSTATQYDFSSLPPARLSLGQCSQRLQLDGVLLDTVHSLESRWSELPPSLACSQTKDQDSPVTLSHMMLGQGYPTSDALSLGHYGPDQQVAVNEVLVVCDEDEAMESLRDLAVDLALLPDVVEQRFKLADKLQIEASVNWSGLKHIWTKGGIRGFSIYRASAGDVLVLVYGSVMPLVLRPLESGDYTFQGFAYVEGLVDGRLMRFWQENAPKVQRFTLR